MNSIDPNTGTMNHDYEYSWENAEIQCFFSRLSTREVQKIYWKVENIKIMQFRMQRSKRKGVHLKKRQNFLDRKLFNKT